MTKVEALAEVLHDTTRSTADRDIAVRGLRRIAEHGEHNERDEAKNILATLPLSQEDEDAKLITSMTYKHRDGTAWRSDDFPAYHYDARLKALCLAVGHPDSCLLLRDRTAAEHHVAILEALALRTGSEVIRNAAQRCIENANSMAAIGNNNVSRPLHRTKPALGTVRRPTRLRSWQVDRGASDFYDFLREHAPTVSKPEPLQLPEGVYLQQTSTGWALLVPSGGAG